MKKLLLTLILWIPLTVFGAPKSSTVIKSSQSKVDQHRALLSKNELPLSVLISTFEILPQSAGNQDLKIELANMNGLKKSEDLSSKIEEYREYTRYSVHNPFGKQKLELYIFQKLKPTIRETKETAISEEEASNLHLDLMVLMDSVTKKTIKSKALFFYKDHIIAEGGVDANSQIKIKDDLSNKLKNCKIQELRVIKNLLGSVNRSLDLQIKFVQFGKLIKQDLNINLLSIKQTPISQNTEDENEIIDEELETEGIEDETTHTNT